MLICLVRFLVNLNNSRILFIPNVINEWNKLNPCTRSVTSYDLFHKTQFHFVKPIFLDQKNFKKVKKLELDLKKIGVYCRVYIVGISPKLSSGYNQTQLFYNPSPINVKKSYKYLSTIVIPNLSLKDQLEKMYK